MLIENLKIEKMVFYIVKLTFFLPMTHFQNDDSVHFKMFIRKMRNEPKIWKQRNKLEDEY